LAHCCSAMKTVPQLRSLDDPENNQALMEKLPDWLVNKWRSKVVSYDETLDDYPPFSMFKEFIANEAKTMNVFTAQSSPPT